MPALEKVRRQGPWEGTAACAARKAGSRRMASQRRATGRRRKRRKGGTRASTSRSRSSGSPAQTAASIGTTSEWWWRGEAEAPTPMPAAAAAEEGGLPLLGNAGGAAVSSSRPRGLVLRIAFGGRDGLVGRAPRGGAITAAASIAGRKRPSGV
nr:unnamed protein product [Digitaria exilis]